MNLTRIDLGKAFDSVRCDQIDNQADVGERTGLHVDDANAADLEFATNLRRCAHEQAVPVSAKAYLIVSYEKEGTGKVRPSRQVQTTQGQVRFSGTRLSADQDCRPPRRNGCAMNQQGCSRGQMRRLRLAALRVPCAMPWAAGSSTMKIAPLRVVCARSE